MFTVKISIAILVGIVAIQITGMKIITSTISCCFNCSRKLYDVCIFILILFQKKESARSCDKGWILYEKNCYHFANSAVSFYDSMVRMFLFLLFKKK